MTDELNIEKLASLARVRLSQGETETLRAEIGSILSYISQITKAAGSELPKAVGVLHNVLRDDGVPHESGRYSEALLSAAPTREGNYVKVKKIVSS